MNMHVFLQLLSLILIVGYKCSSSLVSFLQGDGSNQCKKRGHGTVKGLAVAIKSVRERTQKLTIEFSERCGGPIGPNTRAFVNEVVLFTRK